MSKQQPGWLYIPAQDPMRVPGWVVTSPALQGQLDEQAALQQVKNVATLEGIVEASIAMADLHWGYGFPIGGVAAFDAQKGLISPGGVGYDINCGVRLATAPIAWNSISQTKKEALLQAITRKIKSGPGSQGGLELSDDAMDEVLTKGAEWAVERGWGLKRDLERCEAFGRMPEADPTAITALARERGRRQLGSIGSGNHFVEVGQVAELFAPEVAKQWGVRQGDLYVLIHTGSRGLGHQTCQDALDRLAAAGIGADFVDPQLMSVPIQSAEGRRYWAAMNAAANFAFANRQMVLHAFRGAAKEVLGIPPEELALVYDVCHNMAKREKHRVHGEMRELIVHRKGATRAFGPEDPELPACFRSTGQPVLVPGDMERASYLMQGMGNLRSWCSACHGAGRALSRHKAAQLYQDRQPIEEMRKRGILVAAPGLRTVAEEMPEAYKDVSEVVEATELAGCARKVARLQPALVLKG